MFSSTYKTFKTAASFQFVPIPGVSNFAPELKLRSTNFLSPGHAPAARHFSFNVTKAVHPWENTSEA